MNTVVQSLFDHRIVSGPDALQALEEEIAILFERKFVILCDANTAAYCLPLLLREVPSLTDAPVITVPAGESGKTIKQAIAIWNELTGLQVGRNAVLLNLGGGVVTDLGGFAAACYLRGISFVQLPTSLLAQVDAAIGGKTGVDLHQAKNRVGLTVFPQAVYCWPGFFNTLPEVEWESACGEVVKHALIAENGLWDFFRMNGLTRSSVSEMMPVIQKVKLEVVAQDPYEKGLRKILNAGHTVGHAVESEALSAASPIPHGLAVVIGILVEMEIAVTIGLLAPEIAGAIRAQLDGWFSLPSISGFSPDQLLKWMRMDKKNEKGVILFSLITGIGDCRWNVPVGEEVILSVLKNYCKG